MHLQDTRSFPIYVLRSLILLLTLLDYDFKVNDLIFVSRQKLTYLAMLHYLRSQKVSLTLNLFHEGYKIYCTKLGFLLIVADISRYQTFVPL